MKQSIANFLEFEGKSLLFISVSGMVHIAVKPVCEALVVDYIRQYKNLQEDPILGPALSKQTMQVPGDQARNMVCLPEDRFYGYLFGIKSDSPDLLAYKWECYDLLFKYFNGALTGRKELLALKAQAQNEVNEVMNSLTVEDALVIERSKRRISQINNQLRAMDIDIMEEERTLFCTQ